MDPLKLPAELPRHGGSVLQKIGMQPVEIKKSWQYLAILVKLATTAKWLKLMLSNKKLTPHQGLPELVTGFR